MTPDKFEQTITSVSTVLNVPSDDIYSRSREQHIVDARHIVFYILKHRHGMPLVYIKKFMKDHGHKVHHSTIKYGIDKVNGLIDINHINIQNFK